MPSFKYSAPIFLFSLATLVCGSETPLSDSCFCKLQGEIDDCSCTIEGLDSFNNQKIYPILNSLLEKNFFRYWKTNLRKGCPFWSDDSRCMLQDCKVDGCKTEELPEGLKNEEMNKSEPKNKYTKDANEKAHCEDEDRLDNVDTTISDKSREAFADWKKYDDVQHNFCDLDDESAKGAEYFDLSLNPERFTGYTGGKGGNVWQLIYDQNCFKPDKRDFNDYLNSQKDLCLEKRTFYRMISGLHTSINVHLTANYLLSEGKGWGEKPKWGPKLDEFVKRFSPETTWGEGPNRLKNLYFTYLVELRALLKAAPYLEQEDFYTGDDAEDQEVKEAVNLLINTVKSFPEHFDESKLFKSGDMEMAKLKEEFKVHFKNISRIMDCVGCDRCRLWGKVQIVGMGTALKILFSGDNMGPTSTVSQENRNDPVPFNLKRGEIVALFNAIGRLSKCIREIENFRLMSGK